MAELNLENQVAEYTKDAIVTLSPREHIRLRPGMYIGKLGDGTQSDDGIYVLIKEVVDNSIDEFIMGVGKRIEINIVNSEIGASAGIGEEGALTADDAHNVGKACGHISLYDKRGVHSVLFE